MMHVKVNIWKEMGGGGFGKEIKVVDAVYLSVAVI